MTYPVLVIDIYHGDNSASPKPIDFVAVRASGVIGVIHKASQGTKDVDELYASRRVAIAQAGLKHGAYHFLTDEDGTAQADHFLATAQPDENTLVAADWENYPDDHHYPSAKVCQDFCQRVHDKIGRWPKLYSGNVAKEALGSKPNAFFSQLDLWLCQYGNAWKVQASWQYPWLWQNNGDTYGPGPHTIPGIKGLVDNNTIVSPMTQERLLNEWAS